MKLGHWRSSSPAYHPTMHGPIIASRLEHCNRSIVAFDFPIPRQVKTRKVTGNGGIEEPRSTSHEFSIIYLPIGSSYRSEADLCTLAVFGVVGRKDHMTNTSFDKARSAVVTIIDRRHVAARRQSGVENAPLVRGYPMLPKLLHNQILGVIAPIIRAGARRQKLAVS